MQATEKFITAGSEGDLPKFRSLRPSHLVMFAPSDHFALWLPGVLPENYYLTDEFFGSRSFEN